jgi:beta-1,4-mannosyltransferase
VDMHNYGYTLLYRTKNSLVRNFCEKYEKIFVRWVADDILCVSEAMKRDLVVNWGVKVEPVVVYDRANLKRFGELDLEAKDEFFSRNPEFWDVGQGESQTFNKFRTQGNQEIEGLISGQVQGSDQKNMLSAKGQAYQMYTNIGKSSQVELKQERPFLIVTSTSYTEDEDISMLLKVLDQ